MTILVNEEAKGRGVTFEHKQTFANTRNSHGNLHDGSSNTVRSYKIRI